jgi:heat shock protein 4
VALSYGIFRKSNFDDNPKHVCFVDVGHAKSSVYIVAFTRDKATILNQLHDRDLGARDFDWNMFEFYCNKFQKGNGINLRTKEKSRMRMLDAIEKQRKILSANSEASISVEYVSDDLDLNYNMTRTEFE